MRKHKTVGKLARYLRRHCGLTYEEAVAGAIGHFRASGAVGIRILKGSKLTHRGIAQ
jgi:hypothetical protein